MVLNSPRSAGAVTVDAGLARRRTTPEAFLGSADAGAADGVAPAGARPEAPPLASDAEPPDAGIAALPDASDAAPPDDGDAAGAAEAPDDAAGFTEPPGDTAAPGTREVATDGTPGFEDDATGDDAAGSRPDPATPGVGAAVDPPDAVSSTAG